MKDSRSKSKGTCNLTEKGWRKPSEYSITGAEFQKLNSYSLGHKEGQSIPVRSHKNIQGENTQHPGEVPGICATDHDAPERVG